MRLDIKHFVASVTTFISVIYIICAAVILIAPIESIKFFNLFFHGIDLSRIAKSAILSDVVLGFVFSVIITVILSALFVYIWNKYYEKMEAK